MRSRRALAWSLALVAPVLGTGACDTGDGRSLRPPAPGATAPPMGTSTVSTSRVGEVLSSPSDNGVSLLSSAFVDGGPIPVQYSPCPGENLSPPLQWSGIPANVVELAIHVSDPAVEGGGFVHWVVAGLEPSLVGLAEGTLPEGAVEARNDTSEFGWYGPCPPEGQTHSYVFTLYALTERTDLEPGVSADDAMSRIATIPGYAATLTGTYTGVP